MEDISIQGICYFNLFYSLTCMGMYLKLMKIKYLYFSFFCLFLVGYQIAVFNKLI